MVNNAEYVAFYNGAQWERNMITGHFKKLHNHKDMVLGKKFWMGIFDSMLVKYGAVLVGYSILGLPVFGPGSKEYIKNLGTD